MVWAVYYFAIADQSFLSPPTTLFGHTILTLAGQAPGTVTLSSSVKLAAAHGGIRFIHTQLNLHSTKRRALEQQY